MKCDICKARASYTLCDKCSKKLKVMLVQLPWLLDQLSVTRFDQDRLSSGQVGKGNERRNPLRLAARDLTLEVQTLLELWVDRLVEQHGLRFFPPMRAGSRFIGPLRQGWERLPAGYEGTPQQRAKWLLHHSETLIKRVDAGDFYAELKHYVGDPGPDCPHTQEPGALYAAINRSDRQFAGSCPAVRAYSRDGSPIECRTTLWAVGGQEVATCSRCDTVTDVRKNLAKAASDNDLQTEKALYEYLNKILEEPVSTGRLRQWITSKRLPVRGYLQNRQIVENGRRGDARVFSLSQARHLRWQELNNQKEGHAQCLHPSEPMS